MKKILVLAFALAVSPAIMAKGLNHSTKPQTAQKSSQAKSHHTTTRSKAKPVNHQRTAKLHTNRTGTRNKSKA